MKFPPAGAAIQHARPVARTACIARAYAKYHKTLARFARFRKKEQQEEDANFRRWEKRVKERCEREELPPLLAKQQLNELKRRHQLLVRGRKVGPLWDKGLAKRWLVEDLEKCKVHFPAEGIWPRALKYSYVLSDAPVGYEEIEGTYRNLQFTTAPPWYQGGDTNAGFKIVWSVGYYYLQESDGEGGWDNFAKANNEHGRPWGEYQLLPVGDPPETCQVDVLIE